MRAQFSGVYMIQSKSNPGIQYIGASQFIGRRWDQHLGRLRQNKHNNPLLQNHYNLFGEADLIFMVMLKCNVEDLEKNEKYFIDTYKPYCNIQHMGEYREKLQEEAIQWEIDVEEASYRRYLQLQQLFTVGNN